MSPTLAMPVPPALVMAETTASTRDGSAPMRPSTSAPVSATMTLAPWAAKVLLICEPIPPPSASAAFADARVEVAIAEVDEEVRHNYHDRDDEHVELELGVVAIVDRLEGQASHPGQREDRFDDDRTADEDADLRAHDR